MMRIEGTTTMATIVTIETPSLGDRSYLAHDGEVAIGVDPQRDIDRVLAVADTAGACKPASSQRSR